MSLALLLLLQACGSGPVEGAAGAGAGLADGGAREDGGAGGSADSGSADSGSADSGGADTGVDFCADAVTVTWASFGQGFLLESCQGCHASTSVDRHGAPEEVSFDSVEDAWTWAPLILSLAALEPIEMPPMGGTTEDDRTRLRWWLECGTPGT